MSEKGKEEEGEVETEQLDREWLYAWGHFAGELGRRVGGEKVEFGNYYPFLGAIFDYFPWEQKSKIEEFKKRVYQNKLTRRKEAAELADELISLSPLRERKAFEIGGPFVQVLHLLGAKRAVCIDPEPKWLNFKPEREGYQRFQERFDFTRPEKQVGGEKFDLVISRETIASFSGLAGRAQVIGGKIVNENVAYGGRTNWSDEEIAQGMLASCAFLTKKGGLNIHSGDLLAETRAFWPEVGFEFLVYTQSLNIETFVFKKI